MARPALSILSTIIANAMGRLLGASLLVWPGSLVAELLLPINVFKSLRSGNGPNLRIL
jgi:hypothetical protein